MDLGIGSMQLETLFSIRFWASLFCLVAEKISDRNCKDTKLSRNCVRFVRKHKDELSFVVLNHLGLIEVIDVILSCFINLVDVVLYRFLS